MEVNRPVKVEDLCLKQSRHARRKRLEIKRLKSSFPSDDHDPDHVEDNRTSWDGNDEEKYEDETRRDGLCVPSISLFGASKNDVPKKPKVGMLVNTVGGSDDFGRDGLRCNSHGSVSVCGRRREMEDTVTIIPGLISSLKINRQFNHGYGFNLDDGVMEMKYDFYAVYDGHGGSGVANVCRDQLHRVLVNEIESCDGDEIDWENVMVSCFMKMDDAVSGEGVENEEIKSIGSTAVVALISTDQIIVANCGDSRAVLSRGGTAIPLSQDHRPDRTDEMERVEAAGGRVINWNGYRVLGVLATSRSIGDHYLKPYVISVPEVTITSRTESDEFVILASDGLWDVMSNDMACNIARKCLEGDHYLKPYVISVPEVTITSRTESDEFVILASDGLWDVMSNDMACNIARKCLEGRVARKFASSASASTSNHTSNAALAAAVLAELAMAKGSKDNISVVVVELKKRNR
ncbi:hypothetical protein C5167_047617 [Papaver somniferum]|uniref:protein-serine/threonine phosphatase n=1 Tax=Papaver somniferum TaxID=3469 RepID=A0A4Y7LJN8_PAPSO|nr:hypothetical protein C5167_047617 [Papaver somniferum]